MSVPYQLHCKPDAILELDFDDEDKLLFELDDELITSLMMVTFVEVLLMPPWPSSTVNVIVFSPRLP